MPHPRGCQFMDNAPTRIENIMTRAVRIIRIGLAAALRGYMLSSSRVKVGSLATGGALNPGQAR
jgi:hypothetical protein